MNEIFDCIVIGGGINGVGIALDASGRQMKVALIEANDLSSGASSNSSNLIHGGLRYLEQGQIKLVRQCLKERSLMLSNAYPIVKSQTIIMPCISQNQPLLLTRLGLKLYDFLGSHKQINKSKLIKNQTNLPIKEEINKCIQFDDGTTFDSRLVITIAKLARSLGAKIFTRHKIETITKLKHYWLIKTYCKITNTERSFKATTIVNACGANASKFLQKYIPSSNNLPQIRLIKGSHIIVKYNKLKETGIVFKNIDKRTVFALPYTKDHMLIGTTELEINDLSLADKISEEEKTYLISAANTHLKHQISKSDIVETTAGARALIDNSELDPHLISREHFCELENFGNLKLLTIAGGKLTAWRSMAEQAVNLICKATNKPKSPWTSMAVYPGCYQAEKFKENIKYLYPWLPSDMANRLFNTYGTEMKKIIGSATNLKQLTMFGLEDLTHEELKYLINHEWAITTDDILRRRCKLNLYANQADKENLRNYLKSINVLNEAII